MKNKFTKKEQASIYAMMSNVLNEMALRCWNMACDLDGSAVSMKNGKIHVDVKKLESHKWDRSKWIKLSRGKKPKRKARRK